MSQRCPVCKARLWTDPLFSPARLQCPRCGATFATTVQWGYFRILLLLVILLTLLLIADLPDRKVWLVVFLVTLGAVLWYLPRLINLQRISGELRFTDGIMDADQMKLKFTEEEEKEQQLKEANSFWGGMALLVGLTILILFLVVSRFVSLLR
jgi:bacteriorhodopsin